MRAAGISIRPAESGDRGAIAELLSASRLVPLDETAQFGPQYAVAVTEDGRVTGVAGYERYGREILLRSVAVAEACRSMGIGARPTADRLAHAKAQGCAAAYLVPDTARGYWARHGFSRVEAGCTSGHRAVARVECRVSTQRDGDVSTAGGGLRRACC